MNSYLSEAIPIAREAGELLKEMAKTGLTVEYKGSANDLVTNADKAAQTLIRERLNKAFPGHRFIGEEDNLTDREVAAFLKSLKPGEGCWIVDPLDGTTNYVKGINGYAVSMGLYLDGGIAAGVIYAPVEGELFYAARGEGAYLDGRRLHVSDCAALSEAFIATGIPPVDLKARREVLGVLQQLTMRAFNIRMLGSAAREIAYVAAGRLDAYWEIGPHPWDIAAGMLLVTEAGGVVLTAEGEPYELGNARMLLATPGVAREIGQISAESNK